MEVMKALLDHGANIDQKTEVTSICTAVLHLYCQEVLLDLIVCMCLYTAGRMEQSNDGR